MDFYRIVDISNSQVIEPNLTYQQAIDVLLRLKQHYPLCVTLVLQRIVDDEITTIHD